MGFDSWRDDSNHWSPSQVLDKENNQGWVRMTDKAGKNHFFRVEADIKEKKSTKSLSDESILRKMMRMNLSRQVERDGRVAFDNLRPYEWIFDQEFPELRIDTFVGKTALLCEWSAVDSKESEHKQGMYLLLVMYRWQLRY